MATVTENRDKLEVLVGNIFDLMEEPVLGPGLEMIRSRFPQVLQNKTLVELRMELHKRPDSFKRLLRAMECWPAVCVLLLTDTVARAYSPDNEYAVYAPLLGLLGRQCEFSATEKDQLWKRYRRTCERLRFTVNQRESGVGHIVDEFLHQVGLPLCFVDRVTDLMAATVETIGRPDDDDPDRIRQWQEYLLRCSGFRGLPPHARKPLEEDVTGYYVRLFLRTAEMPAVQANSVAGRMAAALAAGGRQMRRSGGALRIPQLLWRNDELVIELPSGEAECWTIQVDGNTEQYRGEAAARIVPVMEPLPKLVEVDNGSGSPHKFALWPDDLDNRLLVFDEDGFWRAAGQLNTTSLMLAPGNYQLLLRFVPQGRLDEVEHLQDTPSLYRWPVSLQPGECIEIRRGPALLKIEADQRPRLGFEGDSLTSTDGDRIYLARGLHVLTAGLDGAAETLPGYEIHFTSGEKDLGLIPAEAAKLDLTTTIGELAPGLHRLLAELRPRGTQRAIARAAVLVWKGLEQQDRAGRLICRQKPQNLVDTGCDNVLIECDAKRLAPRDTTRQDFTLEFKMAHDHVLAIRWPVPGVFLELEDHSAQPVERRRLPLDRLLPVTCSSRQLLRVSSTESGRILLQQKEVRVVKARRPVPLPLSSLCGALEGGEGSLIFDAERGPITLARLTAPHEVRAFELQRTPYEHRLQLAFAAPCTETRIHAQNLLTGEEVNETARCDDPDGWNEHRRLQLESLPAEDGWAGCLTLRSANWPAGAWLVHFDVCLAGRWGRPTNARQDVFALPMLLPGDGSTVRDLNTLLELVPLPGDAGAQLQVLTRVHKTLLVCYAELCWPDLKCLAQLWTRLVKGLPFGNEGILCSLIQISGLQPPESAPVSWLPLKNIVAERLSVLAAERHAYSGLSACHGPLAAMLGVAAQINESLLRFLNAVTDVMLALGFGQQCLHPGGALKKFEPNNYRSALLCSPLPNHPLDGWQPASHNYLGRTHYTMAWEQMRQRYRDTLSGNDLRRSRALGLCKQIMRQQPAFALHLYGSLTEEVESAANERMLLSDIETFLSALARACRREAREPGALATLHAWMKKWAKQNSCHTDEALSYMLGIGTELFAFYLLLWEVVLTAEMAPAENLAHHA